MENQYTTISIYYDAICEKIMETLEKTLHLNRDWALKRIHTLCESSDNKDVVDGFAIALEYLEWFEPTYKYEDILSVQFKARPDD